MSLWFTASDNGDYGYPKDGPKTDPVNAGGQFPGRGPERPGGYGRLEFSGRECRPEMMTREALEGEKAGLIAYAHMKLDGGDFHAVADAAMDLREIEAKLSMLPRLEPTVERNLRLTTEDNVFRVKG